MDFDTDGSWCHGQISALEASRRLEDVGSFLVREDSNNQFIVTLKDSKSRVCHAQIPSTKKKLDSETPSLPGDKRAGAGVCDQGVQRSFLGNNSKL